MTRHWIAVCVLLVAVSARAHSGKIAWAYPVSGIVVDGDLSEWPDDLPRFAVARTEHGAPPVDAADLTASMRVGYDAADSSIYIAVEVRDESVVLGEAAGPEDWESFDGLEIYFALGPAHPEAFSQETLYGTTHESQNLLLRERRLLGERRVSDIAIQPLAAGRRYEARVALGSASGGAYELRPYDGISFDLVVGDRDADGSFSWVAWGPGITKLGAPERMGDLLLLERPVDADRALAVLDSLQADAVARARDDSQRYAGLQMLFTGVLLTVTVLHLLLVLFDSQRATNLYYALFTGSAAATIYFGMGTLMGVAPWLTNEMMVTGFLTAICLVAVFGLLFLYARFLDLVPRHFWAIAFGLAVTTALTLLAALGWGSLRELMDSISVVFLLLLLATVAETAHVLIRALWRRQDGAWIIASGSFAFVATAVYAQVAATDATATLLSGLLLPILAVSVHLARDVARVRRSLETRLVEVHELNRRLEQANEQIEIASRHKSDFLARMSHDLRTPMNAIIGYTRILMRRARQVLDDRQFRNLQNIETSASNLLALINEILDLSRIEAGRVEVRPRDVDLSSLASECAIAVEPLLRPGVALVRRIDGGVRRRTDPDCLRRVLMNLLGNAVKFTESGAVTLTVTDVDGETRITVADTGIGIPADDLPHVFEEFRQVDRADGGRHEGSGLGLSIAQRTVQLLGGRVDVASAVGEGTTFTVQLPDAGA